MAGNVAGFSLHAGVAAKAHERDKLECLCRYIAGRGKGRQPGLKCVFNIDIETCRACGGAVKLIACIEDPLVICKILDHLDRNVPATAPSSLPESRAPPQAGLFNTT